MHSFNTSYTNEALQVIANADPATYQHMLSVPWDVYVLIPGHPFPPDWSQIDSYDQATILADSAGASPVNGTETYLNQPSIAYLARRERIPLSHAIATTMVHEFQHTKFGGGGTEAQAFAAQRVFDAKMGDHLKVDNAKAEAWEIRHYRN